MTSMPENTDRINFQEVFKLLNQLAGYLAQASQTEVPAHQVEKQILVTMRIAGQAALQEFFDACGDGDEGAVKTLPDGRLLKRLPELHVKPYLSVFGEVEVSRVVYASRPGQKIEYAGLDAKLQLPEGKYSYLLQEWLQDLAVHMPYATASEHLKKILGLTSTVSAMERHTLVLGDSVADFWDNQESPPAVANDQIVVVSADGKGIPMRQTGGKKMSVVGAVYTIPPYVRSPRQILEALFVKPEQATKPAHGQRPKPLAKQVRAALKRDEEGTMQPSYETILGWLGQQARLRDPQQTQPLVVLMDGQETLWNAAKIHCPAGYVEILDLLHATSYLRKAAALFYADEDQQELCARLTIGYLLEGRVDAVLYALDFWARNFSLSRQQRKELATIRGYLSKNAERMRYAEFLAAGYPIASGVIEGACRYVVKDRMERTGMRWSMAGAGALLGLRGIAMNGDWETFIEFHIARESQRLYPWRQFDAANDGALSLAQVA